MATNSHIEWTEATWNPVTGCDKVSPGCAHCYAECMAKRLKAMGQSNYAHGFDLTLQPQMLELPLRWKRSKRIFVNSMSDMFHADVPLEFIQQAFEVMRRANWHQYQVLTKRSERLLRTFDSSTGSTTCETRTRRSSSCLSNHFWDPLVTLTCGISTG